MTKLKFNLSPSMLKVYKNSQLEFYYRYIEKSPEDTEVCQVYGAGGQICHIILEDYANGVRDGLQEKFISLWKCYGRNKLNLNNAPGLNGKPLDIKLYRKAIYNGIQILKKFKKFKTEEKIIFPFIDNEEALITIKGFIDLQVLDDNEIKIYDWKTSSSKDDFKQQMVHYAYSVWRKYKIIPKLMRLEYIKINDFDEYKVKKEDLIEYEKFLKKTADEIISKGHDKSKYELGNWDNIFNPHKKACQLELNRRQHKKEIEILRNGAGGKVLNPLPENLLKMLVKHCSYEVKNSHFRMLNTKGWDGRTKLFNANKRTFPIGLKHRVERVFKDYENFTREGYTIKWTDNRKELPDIKMPSKLKDIELRDYQKEAVEIAMNNEMGNLTMATGTGKTLVATEITRKVKKKTLFTVNRIELARQTKLVFDTSLGIDCNLITEGEFNDGDVCIATFQTIMAYLQRRDKRMIDYLASVGLWIADESHTCKANSFLKISSLLTNVTKRIGLTGTWNMREDGEDMKVEGCVGKEMYKYKEEALTSGYLARPDITFIKIPNDISMCTEYQEEYDEYIVDNTMRNKKIKDLALKTHKDKQILILTKLVRHSEYLADELGAEMITGSSNKKYRKDIFEKFKKGKVRILVGTISIFQLGIDIPELDLIINCAGMGAKIGTIQSLGRVLRKGKDKHTGYYIDFIDEGGNYVTPASWKRFQTLKTEGHKPRVIEY